MLNVNFTCKLQVGVNAGDGINYSWLCISRTSAITELEQQTMTVCDVSNNGLAVFRMDSNNPNQGRFERVGKKSPKN